MLPLVTIIERPVQFVRRPREQSCKWSGNDLMCERVKRGLVLLIAIFVAVIFLFPLGELTKKRHISTKKHTELAETSAGQSKLIAPRKDI